MLIEAQLIARYVGEGTLRDLVRCTFRATLTLLNYVVLVKNWV
jgi:hypothetical protein